jgi:Protein of unknown function (DUF3822)
VKQLFHIEAIDVNESVQPVLSIRLGEKHCCFSITDYISNQLKDLAYYTTDEVNGIFLNELFATHDRLNSPFYKVLICYDYFTSSLIAFKNYKHEDAGVLLNTMFGLNKTSSVISEAIAEWQLYNVYAVPEDVKLWMHQKFPSAKYWHQYTLNIKNSKADGANGHFLLDIRKEDFTLLASVNNEIVLAQTFQYATPVDVLFYLMNVCRQFGLSQQQVKVDLSGLVDRQSALYNDLHQYFMFVEFRDADWKTDNEYPAHFFTSLNDLSGCAL